jgi:D-glycero-D-manno-heptose 1,7-bisphosphate phosphatase
MAPQRAIFLDRDGTLVVDVGYPRDPDRVELLPGAAAALRRLSAQAALVIVSNQSGIGRGLIAPDEARAVHDRMIARFADEGVTFAGSYYCPHAPDDDCACRKPQPGLLLQAARELDLDLPRSVMVGDKPTDVEVGRAAGCAAALLFAASAVATDVADPRRSAGVVGWDSAADKLASILE